MGGSASSAWWRTCTKARPPRPVAGRRVAFVGPPVLERGVRPREDPRRRRSHRRRRARSLPFEGLRLRMLDTHAVVRSLTDAEIHAGPGGRHHERGPSGRRPRRPCPARSVHGQPRRGEGRNRRGADGDRRVAEAPVPVPSTDALPGPRSRRSARLRLLELAHRKPGGGGLHGLPPKSGTVTAAARRVARDRRYRPARLPRRMEGTTGATRAVRPTPSACRSSPLARAGARRQPRRRRGRGLGPFDGYPPRPLCPQSWPLAQVARVGHRVPRRRTAGGGGRHAMGAAPSAPSRYGKRGQQVRRRLERRWADAPFTTVC